MHTVSILTRKAILDVTRRKGHSILMILGIFIGVLGLTTVNIANDSFGRQFLSVVAPNDVPNATFNVAALSPSALTVLQHASNVETVETRTQLQTGWKLADGRSASIDLNGYQDWRPTVLDTFQLTSGRWPGRGEIVMASRDRFVQPVSLGDTVTILTNGQPVVLRVVGLAYTVEQTGVQALAYMSADGLQRIAPATMGRAARAASTPPALFSTEILIRMRNRSFASVQLTSTNLTQLLKTAHIPVFGSRSFSTTNQQDTQHSIAGVLNILLVLASLAFLLVCVMLFNTVTMLLTEQMKVIGTMKALGGTRRQIVSSYLVSIGLYALIGTAFGLGLGLLLFSQVTSLVANQARIDLPPFQIAPWVLLISIAVGLLVPLLAAVGPLWIGTGISVREAMAAYGVRVGKPTRARAWGCQVYWLPQTAWLGLRGVLRRPGRALLTLLALTLSSAVFMAVQVTNQSVAATNYHEENLYNYDMWVGLSKDPAVFQRLSAQIQSLPNVAQITQPASRAFVTTVPGELEIDGLPSPSVYQPQLLAGRWLTVQDSNTLVLSDIAAQRLHVKLGENVTFHLELPQAQQVSWKIVGIVHELAHASISTSSDLRLGMAFTTFTSVDTLANLPPDDYPGIWIFVHDRSPQALQRLRSQVLTIFNQAALQENLSTPMLDQATAPNPLLILYALFDTVAILVALVGLLSLSNTLAASVLERRSEIGILRSLGASGWRIGVVFWIESLALVLIAWSLGIALGLPGEMVLIEQLSEFVQPLDTVFSPLVVLLTLLFVIVVSIIASFGPALSASRLRLTEILHYE